MQITQYFPSFNTLQNLPGNWFQTSVSANCTYVNNNKKCMVILMAKVQERKQNTPS